MFDVSGAGLSVKIVAVPLFPQGIDITEFADDEDALSVPNVTLREYAMGLNGDLVSWITPNPIVLTIGVLPGSEADKNLGLILDADKYEKNKLNIPQSISMVINYADGTSKVLPVGVMTEGPALSSVQSSKRVGTKTYTFVFEGKAN